MTLHVLIGNFPNASKVSDLIPIVEIEDEIVLVYLKGTANEVPQYKHYTSLGNTVPYAARRTGKAVWDHAEAIDGEAAEKIEGQAEAIRVYKLIECNHVDILSTLIAHIISLLNENFMHPNLDEIAEEIAAGNPPGLFNIDGTPYIPPPQVAVGIDAALAATTSDELIGLIRIIDPALKYLGFNPRFTRLTFLKRDNNVTILARDLILCFSAYAHIANNISKLSNKRVNVDVSRKVMSAVNAIGILKKATQKEHLTLPRLAIAFMPEYLIYRKFMVTDLQNQTDASIPVVYKDIIFHGCDAITSMASYLAFHKEFASLIYKPGEETPLDDPKFLSNYNRWAKVTKSGYRNDTQIHNNMTNAISLTGKTPQQALGLIVNNLTVYKSNP